MCLIIQRVCATVSACSIQYNVLPQPYSSRSSILIYAVISWVSSVVLFSFGVGVPVVCHNCPTIVASVTVPPDQVAGVFRLKWKVPTLAEAGHLRAT